MPGACGDISPPARSLTESALRRRSAIALCLGRPTANFERSREIGDRQKPGQESVVDHERPVSPRRGKLCDGGHGPFVLGEQRDLLERNHRVPHASRIPVAYPIPSGVLRRPRRRREGRPDCPHRGAPVPTELRNVIDETCQVLSGRLTFGWP
jgi:hypothetical protein